MELMTWVIRTAMGDREHDLDQDGVYIIATKIRILCEFLLPRSTKSSCKRQMRVYILFS